MINQELYNVALKKREWLINEINETYNQVRICIRNGEDTSLFKHNMDTLNEEISNYDKWLRAYLPKQYTHFMVHIVFLGF